MPENVAQVKQEVRDIILTKTRDEWVDIFRKTDACVEPVLTLTEAFSDALVKEREALVDIPLPGGGR